MKKNYPRNIIGNGSKQLKVSWPNKARLALQIVLNYEEGGENCILHEINIRSLFYLKLLVLSL